MRIAAPAFLLASALAASAAIAGPNTRTDVTYGDIVSPANFTSVNGVKAWAFGSHTCNIGPDSLAWGGTTGTPAFVANLYRLHNGRLLQVGMSWAKHSVSVANGNGVCGTCSTTGGAGLRPFCTDIYSASFNAGQSRLGPRSLINPFEGTFVPRTSQTFNSIDRRLQARESDLSPANFPGALFFTEAVYVAADEAPAAQLNNASFRRVTFDASFNVAVADTTQRERPAIFAWRDHGLGLNQPDASVVVAQADFPAEGRVFVAGKASQTAGRWRYEYAVFNLNSHVGVGSLSVPLPDGASVAGIGVHAPTYHSGELVSNAPWISSQSPDAMVFSTPQKFEDNEFTSAIRWGTMHNFWFETDAPPAPGGGSVQITGFRTPLTALAPGLPVPGPFCRADFNANRRHDIDDVLAFVAAWFTGDPRCDVDSTPGVSIDDVFVFLNRWFAPC
jgi:hypothetical protein